MQEIMGSKRRSKSLSRTDRTYSTVGHWWSLPSGPERIAAKNAATAFDDDNGRRAMLGQSVRLRNEPINELRDRCNKLCDEIAKQIERDRLRRERECQLNTLNAMAP
jgi:hypothetical protein